MTHVDPDVLALLALGEDAATDEERAHIADCAECRELIRELASAAAVGRTVLELDRLVSPPPRVWDAVAAELDLPADVAPVAVLERPVPDDAPRAVPHVARRRRSRRRLVLLAVAAAVVLLAAGITAGIGIAHVDQPRIVAEAVLSHLPGFPGASGRADIEQYPDGRRVVVVTTNLKPSASAGHEVWLMDAATGRRVEVGFLKDGAGEFPLPEHVDLKQYSYIDISVEPHDGDPAPSGRSVVRGPLGS
ncbi:anti-sigma factor [Amnibacterium sp. CER49]|uniref:anti-sigma factor n=1 Tax=Amnibacterium sp. CER49 TaxID=3039161 RepID=UPI002449C922|nr:anti-sigma factor [Amnibacterium sp. CER49]MDH2443245.1 anti-sigma factor [Amnibacterium sp. CER49]